MEEPKHVPVMLAEVLQDLKLRPGMVAVDGTLGLGGHAMAIAERIAPGGRLLCLDRDPTNLDAVRQRLESVVGVEVTVKHADFRTLPMVLETAFRQELVPPYVDAALLDLGVSSAQLDDPARGMSFLEPGPLDMRLDPTTGEPASAMLNRMSPGEIERALREYGDENWAKRIAQVIVDRRKLSPLRTTQDLVDCVLASIPPAKREKRIHPATRTFQAVRILVNGDLKGLEASVCDIALCLKPGGVLSVISFHSGEDREVKHAFRSLARNGFVELTKKPRVPSDAEVRANPRSRSAKLRSITRSEVAA